MSKPREGERLHPIPIPERRWTEPPVDIILASNLPDYLKNELIHLLDAIRRWSPRDDSGIPRRWSWIPNIVNASENQIEFAFQRVERLRFQRQDEGSPPGDAG